jgi:excisionase family DNA binding protein
MSFEIMLDHEELQRRLGCSRSTAYGLTASGALPSVRLGRAVRIAESALAAFIEAGGVAKIPRGSRENGQAPAAPLPQKRKRSRSRP